RLDHLDLGGDSRLEAAGGQGGGLSEPCRRHRQYREGDLKAHGRYPRVSLHESPANRAPPWWCKRCARLERPAALGQVDRDQPVPRLRLVPHFVQAVAQPQDTVCHVRPTPKGVLNRPSAPVPVTTVVRTLASRSSKRTSLAYE